MKLETKLLIAREVLVVREPLGTVKGAKIDVSSAMEAHYIPNTLPTITPVPTATPTIAPSATPETWKKNGRIWNKICSSGLKEQGIIGYNKLA